MIRAIVLIVAATLFADRGQDVAARVCRLPAQSLATATDSAAWCAREFIIRNGYTAAPPSSDREAIALEPTMDVGRTYDEMLSARRNTVSDIPVVSCVTSTGYLVSFRMPNQLNVVHARGVVMTREFLGLTLLRPWVPLSDSVPPHCAVPRLPPATY